MREREREKEREFGREKREAHWVKNHVYGGNRSFFPHAYTLF